MTPFCDCGQPATTTQAGDPCCAACLSADGLRVSDREREVRDRTRVGESARQIAEALGVTQRTVCRTRARLGISQPAPAPKRDRTCPQCRRKFRPRSGAQERCGNACRLRYLHALMRDRNRRG